MFLKVFELVQILVDKESHIESRAKTGLRALVTLLHCGWGGTQN